MSDRDRLLEDVEKSMKAVKRALTFFNQKMDEGLPLTTAAQVNSQITRAQGDLIHFRLVRRHLRAAETVVAPLAQDELAKLDELGAILDQAIRDDFLVNATLALAKKVIGAAEDISNLAEDHSTA